MAKRVAAVILAFITALSLCGCGRFDATIEDLLVAPQLSDDQNAVLTALSESTDAHISLKYPSSGSNRTPIQFADIDADGDEEALLCYSLPSEGVYARFAVLDRTDSGYKIVCDIEGPGTDVASITLLDVSDDSNGSYVLIEWASISKSDYDAVIYKYFDGTLSEVRAQSCLRLIVDDLDSDGSSEIYYIYTESTEGPFMLRCVGYDSGYYVVSGTKTLNKDMLGCVSIISGRIDERTRAIFIDENIGGGNQTTEVFDFSDGTFTAVADGDAGISTLAVRPVDSEICQAVGTQAFTLVPAVTPPGGGYPDGDNWVYWYSLAGGTAEVASVMYVQSDYYCGLAVPQSMYECDYTISEDDEQLLTVSVPRQAQLPGTDADTATLLQLRIVTAGQSADAYLRQGFVKIGSCDRYNFYVRFNCTDAERTYILENFEIFN